MPADSTPIVSKQPDDLTEMLLDLLHRVQWKFLGLMVLAFLMLSSDIFINRVLSLFNGAVDYKTPTSWGTCLQGLFLALIMLTVDALIGAKVI